MAIDVRDLVARPLDPVIAEELDIFERTTAEYLDGRVDEDAYRVFRLNHGVYGQRQGGRNQMLRVKIPHGRVTPEQLDTFAYIADVFVLPEFRRAGLAKWLVTTALTHPALQGLRRVLLATKDAHAIYALCGFAPLARPERFMEINRPDIYSAGSG